MGLYEMQWLMLQQENQMILLLLLGKWKQLEDLLSALKIGWQKMNKDHQYGKKWS